MPAAGKTTVTALAAQLLPRAARVKGDDVDEMTITGRVWFMGNPRDEACRQDELITRNLCALANNFIDFGFTVLMDTLVADRAELDFFHALLSPRPVRLVTLAPGVEACRNRNAMRDPDDRFDFDGYERLEDDMRRDLADVGWWFDTADLTAAQTADRLVHEAIERAKPLEAAWHARLRDLHDA